LGSEEGVVDGAAVAGPARGALEAPPAAAWPAVVPGFASVDPGGDPVGDPGDPADDPGGDPDAAGGVGGDAGVLLVADAVPRVAAGVGDDPTGLGEGGFSATVDGGGRGAFSAVPHGARMNRLRGRSLPNHPAIHGPTRSASTSATPAPRNTRNQRAVKMLGWRRTRCETSDLMRLMLEFPKYYKILAGQC
jgi:hypothetical protein